MVGAVEAGAVPVGAEGATKPVEGDNVCEGEGDVDVDVCTANELVLAGGADRLALAEPRPT